MKRKATEEERFWRFLERNHKVVSRWPSWMKGGNAIPEGKRHSEIAIAKEESHA